MARSLLDRSYGEALAGAIPVNKQVPTQNAQSAEGSLVDRASQPGGANPRNFKGIVIATY